MAPFLKEGDEILVDAGAYETVLPTPGDVVIARHPYQKNTQILKRVGFVRPNGECELYGDNPPQSTDSRSFGALPPVLLLGKVTGRKFSGRRRSAS